MKVKALKSFSLGGGRDVHTGEVFDMPDAAARIRVLKGWLVQVKEEPAPEPREPEHPEALGPEAVTARDPEPHHRDPAPPARGKKGQ